MDVENKALQTEILVSQILMFHFHDFEERVPSLRLTLKMGPLTRKGSSPNH